MPLSAAQKKQLRDDSASKLDLLYLNGPHIQELAAALCQNNSLTSLTMRNSSTCQPVAEELCDAIEKHPSLATLIMAQCHLPQLGSSLAKALLTNTSLTYLHLQDCSLKDAGAQALAEALKTNSTVSTLSLMVNRITEAGAVAVAEALETNSSLTTLGLKSNRIGDDGCEMLMLALKLNSSIRILRMENTGFGDKSAMALADVLKTNKTLTWVNVMNNRITSEGGEVLLEASKDPNAWVSRAATTAGLSTPPTNPLDIATWVETCLPKIIGSLDDADGDEVLDSGPVFR